MHKMREMLMQQNATPIITSKTTEDSGLQYETDCCRTTRGQQLAVCKKAPGSV